MQPLHRIVVGVETPLSRPWLADDLSTPCHFALKQAIDVAEAMNVPIDLVTVLPEITTGLFRSEEQIEKQTALDAAEADVFLQQIVSKYASVDGIEITPIVAHGRAWFQLLKLAQGSRNNLIVCGTRDKGAIGNLLFGSTGLKLLRYAPCAVWLVKPREDDDPNLDVVAATDLSPIGEDVIHAAVSLGQTLPVRLTVLHVLDQEYDRHMARTGVSPEEIAEYRQQAREEAESQLNSQLATTDYRTVEKGVQVQLAEGPAEACILSALTELDTDLLVMATSGRGGLAGMLFGSTAERLLPELTCGVLALKPDDFVCPIDLNDGDE